MNDLASFLYAIARSPVTHLRLIAATPMVWIPAAAAVALIVIAWQQDRRAWMKARLPYATETFAALFGIATYTWFFHAGNVPWSEGDWREEWTFFAAWPQALGNGDLPYYLATARQGTERYFANLQTPMMPYVFALTFVSVNTFVMLHTALVYAIGLLGAVALRRELALSFLPWTAFVLVFTLNGHITAHLSAGHLPWIAYFLIPWVLWSSTRIANGEQSMRTRIACAAALAGMILIGGWHVFVWSLLFLTFTCLWALTSLRSLVIIGTLTGLLAAARLVPAITTFGAGSNVFISGFPSLASMLAALAGTPERSDLLDPWELDAFVGSVGLLLLCLGAVAFTTRKTRALKLLLMPSFVLAVLSFGNIYEMTLFNLPGLVSQRVTTRLLVLPVLWLAVAGAVTMDGWWTPARNRIVRAVTLGGAAFLALQLLLRAHAWRPHAEMVLPNPEVLKLQSPEAAYFWAFWIGVAISTVTTLAVVVVLTKPSKLRL